MPVRLKTVYANLEEIPSGYEELYTERNGQFELTGIEGVKTQGDIDRLQASLVKERKDHKETREKYAVISDLDPQEVATKIENYDSLNEQFEALKAAGGTFDEEKMAPIIEARVRQAIGPMEREKTTLSRKLEDANKKYGEAQTEIGSLKGSIVSDKIERQVRDAAITEKVLGPAVNDAVLHARGIFEIDEATGKTITRDGVPGVTPGLSPKEWLDAQKENSPHWWPTSVGGGSKGGGAPGSYAGADNPWSKEGWNVTKQGQLVKTLGVAKATEIAGRAGVKLGATKPASAAA